MRPEHIPELASQHHLSYYNRLRYGAKGCPVRYSPLSTNFPAHFHHLQLRQLQVAEHQTAWYLSEKTPHDVAEHLSDQLKAAMDEPLTPQSPLVRLKTSISHPINISCLLPSSALLLIKSNSVLAEPTSPVLLNVPASCTAKPGSASLHSEEQPPPLPSDVISLQPDLASAIEAAIEASISHDPPCEDNPAAATRQPSISLSLAIGIPSDENSPWTLQSSLHLLPIQDAKDKPSPGTFSLGNLYMSSCPGKKVRLNGPVNGRSAVCRDIGMDMARMKALGTGCIVCCLDDEELDLLGAPWPAYQKSAQALGIDVLRLPIPEGLPPVTPAYLDMHLGRLIQEYTLNGTPVLVHCRGGVGRAGVVACCWLIKLGLCGWISEPDPLSTVEGTPEEKHFDQVVKFVESVISFVRERRNPKAVETYEQVQFLIDYVEYLCPQHRGGL